MSVTLSPPMYLQFFDPNNTGAPLQGGKLFTYRAGTSVKQATWTDSTQVTQNNNPIVLDGNGAAYVWPDPSLIYKYVLAPANDTDPPSSPIRSEDNIESAITNRVLASFVTGTLVGQGLYPQTAAEIAASVTPINYTYPPMYVDRYGTNTTPGTTSMVAAFNAAVKVAQQGGGTVRYGATGIYLTDAPINCTFGTSANQNGVTIRPDIINIDGAPAATLLAKHTGNAVFDCTGNDCIDFVNVCIQTDPVTFPKVGILWARVVMSVGNNSCINRMIRCRIFGSFSVAVFYNYGSEDDLLEGCYLANFATTAGSKVAVWTANNIFGLTSPFVTIRSGQQSTIDHTIVGCQFLQNSTDAAADAIYIESAQRLHFYGIWIDCRGRALIATDVTNGGSAYNVFNGVGGENSAPLPTYGFFFTPNVAATLLGWTIDGCYANDGTNFLFAPSNVILDNFYLRNCQENANHGLSATLMRNSLFDCSNMILNLGISQQNRLCGDSSNWTITTRTNDFWEDTGATNKSWTPNTSSLTITGALTIFERHCLAHGSLVTVTTTMSAATSIVCVAGIPLSGLPFPPAFRSALGQVFNETTRVPIGAALVDTDGKIYLPAINVGAGVSITITATYFAA